MREQLREVRNGHVIAVNVETVTAATKLLKNVTHPMSLRVNLV